MFVVEKLRATRSSFYLISKTPATCNQSSALQGVYKLNQLSCTPPTSDMRLSELDTECIEDDSVIPPNLLLDNADNDTTDIARSIKAPLQSKQNNSKKRQANQEYTLIKNLS